MKRGIGFLLIVFLLIGALNIISANPNQNQQMLDSVEEKIKVKIEEKIKNGILERKFKYELKDRKELEIRTKLKLRELINNKTNKSFFETNLSNGSVQKLRVMPNELRKIAIEKLKSNNVSVEIKEVRHKNIPRIIYNIEANKNGRFLGIFKMKVKTSAEVDPETGEVLRINKPWWAFLVSGENDEEIEEPANETNIDDEIACTQEAKICSDGSAVERNPNNNCEFDLCPNETNTTSNLSANNS